MGGVADDSLSNLTITGVNNLVKYAYELDWDNATTVSTTNVHAHQTYICPEDGYIITHASGAATSSTTLSVDNRIYKNDVWIAGEYNTVPGTTTKGAERSAYAFFFKGETVKFDLYINGTNNGLWCKFVPFKK